MMIGVAACSCKPASQDSSINLAGKVTELNESIHNEWSKLRPLTVNNEIVIETKCFRISKI